MGSKHWQQRSLQMVSGPCLDDPDAVRHPELLLRPTTAITTLALAELKQRLQQAQTLKNLPAFMPERVLEGNEAAIFETGEPRGLYCALWCGVWAARCALGLSIHCASVRINPDRQSIRLVSKSPVGWPVYVDCLSTALNLAVDLIEVCIEEPHSVAARLQPRIDAFRELAAVRKEGFSNFLIRAATQRGIPCFPRLIESSSKAPLLQFGVGAGSRLIRASSSDGDSSIGARIAGSKPITSQWLQQLGLPTPKTVMLPVQSSVFQLLEAAENVGWPCVVKPDAAEKGYGVTVNITTPEALVAAMAQAVPLAKREVQVQAHCEGAHVRLVVINHSLVRALRGEPPFVVGDGAASIAALIEARTESWSEPDPVTRERFYEQPQASPAIEQHLAQAELTLQSVPEAGQRVVLSSDLVDRMNWVYSDWLDLVHPSVQWMAESISHSMALPNAGIDVITTDLAAPLHEGKTQVIEVNSTQMLQRLQAESFIDALFPSAASAWIPVEVIVCLSAKDAAAHLGVDPVVQGGVVGISPALQLSDSRLLATPLEGCMVVGYSQPEQLLHNRSTRHLKVLLTWPEFLDQGLPCERVSRVELLGEPCIADAERWSSFVNELERLGRLKAG
jgi:cyanophycin synthetase